MEPTKNNNIKWIGDMSVADVLCSAGYLPPRNANDIERFERIYAGKTFETEEYHIDSDAIFDKVRGVSENKVRKMRPMTNQSLLRAASCYRTNEGEYTPEVVYQDIEKKK
jgi:hypothetical protein